MGYTKILSKSFKGLVNIIVNDGRKNATKLRIKQDITMPINPNTIKNTTHFKSFNAASK